MSPHQQNSEEVNTPVFPTPEFVCRHPGFVELWAPQLPSITLLIGTLGLVWEFWWVFSKKDLFFRKKNKLSLVKYVFFFNSLANKKSNSEGLHPWLEKKTSRVFQLNVCGGETSVGRQALTKEKPTHWAKKSKNRQVFHFLFPKQKILFFCWRCHVSLQKKGVFSWVLVQWLCSWDAQVHHGSLWRWSREGLWAEDFLEEAENWDRMRLFFCWRRCPIISNVRYKLYYIILYCIIFYLYHIIILY